MTGPHGAWVLNDPLAASRPRQPPTAGGSQRIALHVMVYADLLYFTVRQSGSGKK